mmetsp:Transcript_14934/g.34482  ORF Transcript_14934/g.34482 Transcript_14934/m.34482 type:complete len:260 (+) Transcript_14934:2086-2865(+)
MALSQLMSSPGIWPPCWSTHATKSEYVKPALMNAANAGWSATPCSLNWSSPRITCVPSCGCTKWNGAPAPNRTMPKLTPFKSSTWTAHRKSATCVRARTAKVFRFVTTSCAISHVSCTHTSVVRSSRAITERWLPMVMSHELRCHCRRSWPETKGGAQHEMVCRSDAVDGRNGAPRKFVYRLVSIVRKHPGARATDVHEHAKPDGAAVLGFVKHHQIERLNLVEVVKLKKLHADRVRGCHGAGALPKTRPHGRSGLCHI